LIHWPLVQASGPRLSPAEVRGIETQAQDRPDAQGPRPERCGGWHDQL